MMALTVSTAPTEWSFSKKLIKTCVRSHLLKSNLEHLMKIAIEGPKLSDVVFDEILNTLNRKIGIYHSDLYT